MATKANLVFAILKEDELPKDEFNELKHYSDELRELVLADYQTRTHELVLPSITTIEDRIKNTFIPGDPRRLIGLIYMWWPLRDDLQLIYSENDSCEDNNIIYKIDNDYYIKICKSKRIGDAITKRVPDEIADLINMHLQQRPNIKYGDYLFGPYKKTWLIQRLMKKLGFKGGINLIRKMHRAKALASKNPETISETAKDSFHSLNTANLYNSKLQI